MEKTITYVIQGRTDGRWVIRAFDNKGRRLGVEVTVESTKEAWRVLWMLNGYGDLEDTIPIGEQSLLISNGGVAA